MKVIRTDNFDRDTRSDALISEGLDKAAAEALVVKLNARRAHEDWYLAVPDEHNIYIAGH